MNPVGKALWFIESHFARDISLDDIAAVAGVSRYHLVRAFGRSMGVSVMRYVRGRRLTEAARSLAGGAPNILAVALDAGYGSHEAFTRAFRDQFGATPEAFRARPDLANAGLVEPIMMEESPTALEPPRFANGKTLLVAGLGERYTYETSAGIPALWQRFIPHLGGISGRIGTTAYGAFFNFDDEGGYDYIAGVETAALAELPDGFSRVRIPARRYAVFTHRDHISTIRRTWYTIWNRWMPQSGHAVADAPEFERYDVGFDPRTGAGGFEIWIPLES